MDRDNPLVGTGDVVGEEARVSDVLSLRTTSRHVCSGDDGRGRGTRREPRVRQDSDVDSGGRSHFCLCLCTYLNNTGKMSTLVSPSFFVVSSEFQSNNYPPSRPYLWVRLRFKVRERKTLRVRFWGWDGVAPREDRVPTFVSWERSWDLSLSRPSGVRSSQSEWYPVKGTPHPVRYRWTSLLSRLSPRRGTERPEGGWTHLSRWGCPRFRTLEGVVPGLDEGPLVSATHFLPLLWRRGLRVPCG